MAKTWVDSFSTSTESFFFASVPTLPIVPLAFSVAAAQVLVRPFSFFVWLMSQGLSSASTSAPSPRPAMAASAAAVASWPALSSASTGALASRISAAFMALTLAGSIAASLPVSFTAFSASSMAVDTASSFFCSSSFTCANSASRARRSFFRSASRLFSLATPTAIRNRWKSSHFTPFAPSSTMTLKINSKASSDTVKLCTAFAYCLISALLRNPSLSLSYFVTAVFFFFIASDAMVFFAAMFFFDSHWRRRVRATWVQAFTLFSSLVKLSFSSAGAADCSPVLTGAFICGWSFISPRLDVMKSVQALTFSVTSSLAVFTASAALSTAFCSLAFSRGA
mmetsp:Transcript_49883/g.106901  ORF Transcript_49883/g.106901 Transcript_49883/m.106901 type:complete len:338 (-) Transcript_49883:1063-2076(-)